MRFAVLGPLTVTGGELPIERRSHLRLLSILLFQAGRAIETDALIDRFWGEDPPPTARAALQTHMSQLRRLLGDGVVTTERGGYRLGLDEHELDAVEFEAAASRARTAARTGIWDAALTASREAQGLWRGAPYPELQDDYFAVPELARLDELRAELIEIQGESLLAQGHGEEAVPELERAVRELPYRERLWELLMLARARLGRTVDALAAYHEARHLFDEVGLEPGPALRELEERVLREDPTLVPSRVRHNLPERRTRFIGRGRELDEIGTMLETDRLVTLVGVGGAGKTRLAEEVAHRAVGRFPDGVFMVDLAPVSDPQLVAVETAFALGLRPEEASAADALAESLRGRSTLILLDNCEHLLEAGAHLVDALLRAGPGIRLLATSRAALSVEGERVYHVRPLPMPSRDDEGLEVVRGADAVQLFADRAALAARSFAVDEENAATIAGICRRLDGLPLAIELAAARMSALSPADVADRLDNRFRLLAQGKPTDHPRHRTLEATIAWSYDLLTDAQQRLFARLSVFNGGFDLKMAETICTGPPLREPDVATLLADLVDRSLVVAADTSGGRRYRLLESTREYARDRLAALDEANAVQRRHRDHFLALARARRPIPDPGWLDGLRGLHDEMEAARTWSLARGDAGEAAWLAATLGDYWNLLGYPGRAIAVLRETLETADLTGQPEREADLHNTLGDGYGYDGDHERAMGEIQAAAALLEHRPASEEKLAAFGNLAAIRLFIVSEENARAVPPARVALSVAEALGDVESIAVAHATLGSVLAWSGEIDEGLEHKRTALALAEPVSTTLFVAMHGPLLTTLMLHPEARRTEPLRVTNALLARFGSDPRLVEQLPWHWFAYVFLESGEWDRAEAAVQRLAAEHREGFQIALMRHPRACLRWMQGRLEEAWAEVLATDTPGLARRWYHDILTLRADVAGDLGRLDEVRSAADRYVGTPVAPAEESMKSAVLRALVRAEVDAGLGAPANRRQEHERRAAAANRQLRELLRRYPHPTGGSVQIETPATNQLLAEAELSRLGTPRPDLWRAAIDQPSFVYWKLYSRWRLAESLLAADDPVAAEREVRDAHADAARIGAELLRQRLEETAAAMEVRSSSGRAPAGRSAT